MEIHYITTLLGYWEYGQDTLQTCLNLTQLCRRGRTERSEVSKDGQITLYYSPLNFITVHCITLHCSVLHCCALQSTTLHCTAPHCTTMHCTAMQCTALHCTALHCTALHCIALHCTAMHCTALHCTTLYCTALHCTALLLCHEIVQRIVGNYSVESLKLLSEGSVSKIKQSTLLRNYLN